MREATETRSASRSYLLRFPDRSDVGCHVWADDAADARFVAASVPIARLLEGVFLPNATPVTEVSAEVDAACRAELLANRDAAEVARTLTIDVTIRVHGFANLRYAWRPTDERVRRVLRPLE